MALQNHLKYTLPSRNNLCLYKYWFSFSRKILSLARDYGLRRVAFGHLISKRPLHVQTLAKMEVTKALLADSVLSTTLINNLRLRSEAARHCFWTWPPSLGWRTRGVWRRRTCCYWGSSPPWPRCTLLSGPCPWSARASSASEARGTSKTRDCQSYSGTSRWRTTH